MIYSPSHKLTFVTVIVVVALLAAIGCKPSKDADENATETPGKTAPTTAAPEEARQTGGSNGESQTEANEAGDVTELVVAGDLSAFDWEGNVGQVVSITGDLVIVDSYDLARRGQVKLARERLFVPTTHVDPNDVDSNGNTFEGGNNVAKVTEVQAFNDQASVIIDDGSAKENLFPPKLFPELGKSLSTVRVGSKVHGVTGKLVKAGSRILLVPDRPLNWSPAKRPDRPDVGDADITIASFNVLNYFTTIDNGKNGARGADTKSEFQRQEAKIVSAILALDADVIGLMELENNLKAETQLVAALNAKAGKEVFSGSGLPKGFRQAPGGSNAIRVGIIYRNDRVEPLGDVAMIRSEAFVLARTPLLQQFQSKSGGSPVTVVVNHFKSKGGGNRADAANKNKGDGQGGYNATRTQQSLAICKFVESLEKDGETPRILVIGDLNAYQQEDPIDALRANKMIDLHEKVQHASSDPARDYSFIYYGQSGSLDHAFATPSLADDVTGVATWHINSDEPRFMDYNEEYNPKQLFHPDPFRSSDHDPVLIGIKK